MTSVSRSTTPCQRRGPRRAAAFRPRSTTDRESSLRWPATTRCRARPIVPPGSAVDSRSGGTGEGDGPVTMRPPDRSGPAADGVAGRRPWAGDRRKPLYARRYLFVVPARAAILGSDDDPGRGRVVRTDRVTVAACGTGNPVEHLRVARKGARGPVGAVIAWSPEPRRRPSSLSSPTAVHDWLESAGHPASGHPIASAACRVSRSIRHRCW